MLVFTAGDAALELWKSIFTPFLRVWISVTGDAPPVAAQVAGQAELFARFVWLLMVLFILRWLILRRNGPGISDYLGLRRFSPWRLVLWVSIFAGVLIVGTALAVLSGDQSGSKSQERLVSSRAPILLEIASHDLAAPLGEELFVRGFLYRGIAASRAGWIAAILLPNLLWTLAHGQYGGATLTALFLLGCTYGLARHYSGSVILPIILHMLQNLLVTYAVYFVRT